MRRYAKAWAKKRGAAAAEAYIPLSFSPGEAYQFDWNHEACDANPSVRLSADCIDQPC